MGINMNFDYEKVIPKAIPMKRAELKKTKFIPLNPYYAVRLEQEADKTSKLYRQKIEADRKRLGLS